MQQNELIPFFTQRKNQFSSELKEVSTRINILATIRIIVALAFLVLGYYYITSTATVFLILSIIALVSFIALVTYHQNLFDKKVLLQELVAVNEKEIAALNHNFDDFPTGEALAIPGHAYTLDLDIFGENSLFQYINRSCTQAGKTTLGKYLSEPLTSENQIEERQNIIKELAQKNEYRENFQANGQTIEEHKNEIPNLIGWFTIQPSFLKNKLLNIIRFLFPALLIVALILSYFSSKFVGVSMIMVLANWAVIGVQSKKINDIRSRIGSKNSVLNKYLKLLNIINDTNFEHPHLKNIKNESSKSVEALKAFAKIISNFDSSLNILVAIIMNTLFLYDLHCVFNLEKWKEKNKDNITAWLNIIAEMDALNSLANFTFCHPQYIFPAIDNTALVIDSENIGHPLMAFDDCVTNSISLGKNEKMIILTGANMSGKSTFLRSLGTNVLLSQIGLPVFATKFTTPVIHIFTSMRVTDSLKERASYFYAELSRLQTIMQELQTGKKMLIILDEVLKGTNSEDKLAGSIELIKKFIGYESLGIIATHDLELGKMEQELPNKVSNYCFESIIQNDELYFDYKLDSGIAKNKNASFLMKKMEII